MAERSFPFSHVLCTLLTIPTWRRHSLYSFARSDNLKIGTFPPRSCSPIQATSSNKIIHLIALICAMVFLRCKSSVFIIQIYQTSQVIPCLNCYHITTGTAAQDFCVLKVSRTLANFCIQIIILCCCIMQRFYIYVFL